MRDTALVLTLLLSCSFGQAGELDVLPPAKPRQQMLRDALRPDVHAALDRRLAAYEARTTPEAIATWQLELRQTFIDRLGGFPARTPLNPRVVGRLSGNGYRIEKLIYHSRPGFPVTAVLYLPEPAAAEPASTGCAATQAGPPWPAVLVPCGHSSNGKAAEPYQRACILLARNGFASLCYDPIGQGERKQVLETDDHGHPLPQGRFSPTTEHTLTGVAPILLGENLATVRVWDGIRSLDYLTSRDDIDPDRIGCTGNSGGGLMTSYLMALDTRIRAATPSCFITTTRLKNERPGPGDAEQNIFSQTADGLDHPDFLMLAAPRPVLICSATRDFVPITGTWQAFRQAKRLYTRLGVPERVNLVETDARHGFSRPLREAMVHWMRRWLLQDDSAATDPVREPEFMIHSDRELQCTPVGQVLLMEGTRSLTDLYRAKSRKLAEQRARWRQETPVDRQRMAIRQMVRISSPDAITVPRVEQAGALRRKGYSIEKLILHPEEGIRLPALLFQPAEPFGIPVLYVHSEGKQADAGPGGSIEKLVHGGQPVLAVDVRGYGETETTPWRFDEEHAGPNAAEFFIAYLLGRSLVGMRADDILTSARLLQERTGAAAIELVAVEDAGVPALHAAAVAPQLFASVQLRNVLSSWQEVINTPVPLNQLENVVHGALRRYDLPDLIRLCGRDRVTIESPRNASREPISAE